MIKIECEFIPDRLEIYNLELGKMHIYESKQPERSKREDLNILCIDEKGNILRKYSRCGALNTDESQ